MNELNIYVYPLLGSFQKLILEHSLHSRIRITHREMSGLFAGSLLSPSRFSHRVSGATPSVSQTCQPSPAISSHSHHASLCQGLRDASTAAPSRSSCWPHARSAEGNGSGVLGSDHPWHSPNQLRTELSGSEFHLWGLSGRMHHLPEALTGCNPAAHRSDLPSNAPFSFPSPFPTPRWGGPWNNFPNNLKVGFWASPT